MGVHVAMLRGVNVGGNNRLSMEALRAVCLALGLRGTVTYIQSGNLVYQQDQGDADTMARKLEAAILDKFGFQPAVLLRTPAELRKAVANNPFANRADVQPNHLLTVFLAQAPSRPMREQILALPSDPEEMHFRGRELYIFYPDGMARPRIPLARIEKMLQCPTTARNWNTVNKLLAMAENLEGAHQGP